MWFNVSEHVNVSLMCMVWIENKCNDMYGDDTKSYFHPSVSDTSDQIRAVVGENNINTMLLHLIYITHPCAIKFPFRKNNLKKSGFWPKTRVFEGKSPWIGDKAVI